ncbi:Hypothetical_protein [Hexamita inflata]|uniref:Hypothetical_protein n=1 Tax=Hexamita inflata TaxID=28002 RepID=A0AA86P592_9EUKA|nr:Hypothetical protein HINF_LOCUS19310 [Hexamita inflata]
MVEVVFENFVNYLRSGNTDKLNIISFQQNQQHKINLSTQLIFYRILTKTVVQLTTFAATTFANIYQSKLELIDNLINNVTIEVQSIEFNGSSTGCIAASNESTLQIGNYVILFSNITSNSRFPLTSSLIGFFSNGKFIGQNIKYFDNNLFSFDALYRNEQSSYWGISGSVINNSTVQIVDVVIHNINILVQCKLIISASALISYNHNSTLTINEFVIQDTIIQASTANTIDGLSVFASGIIGVDNYLNQFGSLNYRSNSTIKNINLYNTTISAESQYLSAYSGGITAVSYSSQNYLTNIQIINSKIFCIGYNYLRIGGINAVIQYSNSYLNNVQITNLQLNATSTNNNKEYNLLCGGIMGGQWIFSNTEITTVNVRNLYILATGLIKQVYAASIIGVSTDNTTIQDLLICNIFINLSGVNIDTSSFIAGFYPSQTYKTKLLLYNANIQSVTINTYNSTQNNINYIISSASSLKDSEVQIEVKNSLSSGYSSINGIRITNCDQLQILDVNNIYQVTKSGC